MQRLWMVSRGQYDYFAFLPIAGGTALARQTQIMLRIIAALIAGYGIYAFIKNQFLSYMSFKSSFAIMWLFVFLVHYTQKGFQNLSERRKRVEGGGN